MLENATAAIDAADDELFLIDGSGFIFRAFFALPQTLTNKNGVPIGAVMGYVNMLIKLLTDMHAPYIAVVFDAARNNFRNDIYEQYKGNRSETPPELIPQFPMIREATAAFDIPSLEIEGYEADDLIATYARLASEAGRKVTIVGSDKDLMQLVTDNVRLYDPIKNKYIGRAEVIEKFGVPPELVIDVQALAGDPTDNVPGVPGIGVKTAAQLILEYGSVEKLLERLDEIKQPKRREALIANADHARISKRLVTLHDRSPVPLALEELKARDPRTEKLRGYLEREGFRTALARIEGKETIAPSPSALRAPSNAPFKPLPADRAVVPRHETLPAVIATHTLITDLDVLKQVIARAQATGKLAIDTETSHITPTKCDLIGIALSVEAGQGYYVPLGHKAAAGDLLSDASMIDEAIGKQLALKDVIAALKPILEDDSVLKIGHNVKYDWQVLHAHGVAMGPCDDTILMSYILDGTLHGHGMDELSQLFLAHKTITYDEVTGTGKSRVPFAQVPIARALEYAAEDAEVTLRLHSLFTRRLQDERMNGVYEDVERPLIPVIAAMEETGIRVDPDVLRGLSKDFGERIAALEIEIHKDAGRPFNIGSPKQLGQILFTEMGLPGGTKTKTGEWSTAAGVLEDLDANANPIVRKILDWRQLSKLKSTYADALLSEINPRTGRVHTSFTLTGTSTGRLASSDPNLQNIPIRTPEGKKIRAAFVTDPGWTILSADYSQVELRLAAAVADVPALKQAFKDGTDIHALTASQIFGVELDQVTSDHRRIAKMVNFGIIYGISGWGLASRLGVPQAEASDFIRRYFARFPEIQNYMEEKKAEARANEYVTTLFGRKCFIPNINSKMQGPRGGAERQAINAPLQGAAADIMKMAMARLPQALVDAGLRARVLLQVHDELVLEAPDDEVKATAALTKQIMENAADVGVPLEVEVGTGASWAVAE